LSPVLWLGRATPDDPRALAALEAACHSHPWTESQLREEVAYGPPGAVLVLRGRGRADEAWGDIRAYCVYRVTLDEMHILNVAVAPGWRRWGLGRWLVRFAMGKAVRDGARRAFLEVRASNREALSLYVGLGFVRAGVRRGYYSEPREDAVLLVRDALAAAQP
jgi:ribosomal-protein-alanine N-acetyltransferase